MTRDEWVRVEAAFHEVLAAGPDDRERALDRACAADAALRHEVQGLLAAEPAAEGLLATPAWEAAARAMALAGDPREVAPRLSAGTRLGHFRIEGLAGSGGMGEVYKAYDFRLGRTVAIKVLPPEFAADAASRQRLEREARAVSQLAHPSICALFDIGCEDGIDYLVLEYLEGRTLAQRLREGPAGATSTPSEDSDRGCPLPLAEALPIAVQIAEALAAAHRQGIVHCDLKPANVMLTRDGVKLLDFGIARVVLAAGDDAACDGAEAQRGTLGYMSPEQLAGREPDALSDLFSFGAVLFEMLTGRRPFTGATPVGLLAAMESEAPRLGAFEGTQAPAAVEFLVRRCLARDPEQRWDSAHLAADVLRYAARHPEPVPVAERLWPPPPLPRRPSVVRIAAPIALAIVIASAIWLAFSSREGLPLRRLYLSLDGFEIHPHGSYALLSPNGSRIAFTKRLPDGRQPLATRRLDEERASVLDGTDGHLFPFFSPDSEWLAFFSRGRLLKVRVQGGLPLSLCAGPALVGGGGSWGDDGTIVVALDPAGGLSRLPASGGVPKPLTTLDPERGEVTHRYPHVLPGSHAVLFTSHTRFGNFDDATIEWVSLETGQRRTLVRGGYDARYLPSGHLVFVRNTSLLAAPFDLGRGEVAGPAVPVLHDVMPALRGHRIPLSFSDDGDALTYTGVWHVPEHSLVWVDRAGLATPVDVVQGAYADPRASRDGTIVLGVGEGFTRHQLGVVDRGRREPRLLLAQSTEFVPAWAPDGLHIAFAAQHRADRNGLFWRRADGAGPVHRLTFADRLHTASSISPDGRWLAYVDFARETGTDVWLLPLDLADADRPVSGTARAFARTLLQESDPAFSPDGAWLAYQSLHDGRPAIFVAAVAGGGAPYRLPSLRGVGHRPLWSATRPEIVYEGADRQVEVIPYEIRGGTFVPGTPRAWPNAVLARYEPDYTIRNFDLAADGKRVLLLAEPAGGQPPVTARATLLLGFFDELRRLAPR